MLDTETEVTLAHGGGGLAMRELIDDVFLGAFDPDGDSAPEDAALVSLDALGAHGDRLAFTTDSYVVHPLFFPGGDLGKLAVCGTINDLAVSGAVPLYLSCAVIAEEGLPIEVLRRVAASMAETARSAGVRVVTGDTKVVGRGACDKLFVNTSGVGVVPRGRVLGVDRARPGDAVLVSGVLGDHGAAILAARGELRLGAAIESDCAALHTLTAAILTAGGDAVRCMRDATRGGVATVLNEVSAGSGVGIELDELAVPLRREVRGVCELLGLDPLYLANEGRLVCVVAADHAADVLSAMHAHPLGRDAAAIGRVVDGRARVVMNTSLGGRRVVDVLVGDQLPRIC